MPMIPATGTAIHIIVVAGVAATGGRFAADVADDCLDRGAVFLGVVPGLVLPAPFGFAFAEAGAGFGGLGSGEGGAFG